jgi:hypothetical protein
MMMSLSEPHRQALGWIEDGLAGSDPRLASMLNIFSRLAAGEEMPAGEKIRVTRGRPAAHRPRRARRHPRLGLQQAMLLLWVIITAGMLAVALILNTSGHNACIQLMGTGCPSPVPQHADASPLDKTAAPRGGLLAPTTDPLRNRSPGPTSAQIDNTGPRANGGSGSPPGRLPAAGAAQSHP